MIAPYQAPRTPADARPPVITWFRAYAATTGLAYLALAAWLGALVWRHAFHPPEVAVYFLELAIGAAAFGAASAAAAFVPYRPWAWTAALVVLGMGLLGPMLPFAAPLLFVWRGALVKAAFGRPP